MNTHALIDIIAVSLGAKLMPKYFREGIDSVSFFEHLQKTNVILPEMKESYDHDITSKSLVGDLIAGIRQVRWIDEDAPAVIYHHGASEIPFDYGFKGIFLPKRNEEVVKANLFLVRAPFHRSMKEFKHGIRTLANVVSMLSVSVCLIEELVILLRERKVKRILVAGTSLGGFIANLHHIHFNSADIYTPLLAGVAMDDAYLNSVYSKAVSSIAKESPDLIKNVLNFEADFQNTDNSNVYPLLAKYDQIVRFERQKESYGQIPVFTINKGHTTGALSYKQLREHLVTHLN